MRHLSIQNRVIWVKGLMIECPLLSAIDTCPLEKYRSMPINEKFKLVDEMTEEQINQTIEYHQKCLHSREETITKSSG